MAAMTYERSYGLFQFILSTMNFNIMIITHFPNSIEHSLVRKENIEPLQAHIYLSRLQLVKFYILHISILPVPSTATIEHERNCSCALISKVVLPAYKAEAPSDRAGTMADSQDIRVGIFLHISK